ncbi:MAG: hypothetical protein H0W78_04085 [Planctomycetes bacterium]|jgi:hypothetical protein|nr:hypothetical protein [Planctomycetota bacterium]
MTRNLKRLMAEAGNLRPSMQLGLVKALLAESDRTDPCNEHAWGMEAQRRLAAMCSGRMRCYTFAQVFGKQTPPTR